MTEVHRPSKVEVNPAIERLIGREASDWIRDAETVIRYCASLARRKRVSAEASFRRDNQKTDVRGVAPGVGEVHVQTEQPDAREWVFGVERDRIGYFKIEKPEKGELEIRSFWKTDLATRGDLSEEPPAWQLAYDERSGAPKTFGELTTRTLFRLGPLVIAKPVVSIIYQT